MNTSEIKKLHELLKDLLEFLQKHRGQQILIILRIRFWI